MYGTGGKKTILFLAASPTGLARLRTDRELREIEASLQAGPHRDFYVLAQRHAVRTQDLRQAMLATSPQIVHFCGHGTGEQGLLLEGKDGHPHPIPTTALAHFFELHAARVECVLLNACLSEPQARAIAQHIPFVIGTPQAIEDQDAISFATGFYEALAAGKPIPFAYRAACSAAEMDSYLSPQKMPVLIEGVVRGGSKTDFSRLGQMSRTELMDLMGFFKMAAAADPGNAEAHHSLGLVYLQLHLYDLASKHFHTSIEVAPDAADSYYYKALASIRGRRPKLLSLGEARDIEALVATAITLDAKPAKYYFLLAILREDYYKSNGLRPPPPSVDELLATAKQGQSDRWETERLLSSLTLPDQPLLRRLRQE